MAELLTPPISDEKITRRHVDDVVVRTYRPDDGPAIRRLYSQGLLEGTLDPDESTADVENPVRTYFSGPSDCLWVAESDGKIVGMVGVGHIGYHVAQVRRLRVDPAYRGTDLTARLLRVVLAHCRRCGDLKLVLDAPLDATEAMAACREGGFQYARTRRQSGHSTLEFYLNLYQDPGIAAGHGLPRRAPRPPRVHPLRI